jgi:hypothetical protein
MTRPAFVLVALLSLLPALTAQDEEVRGANALHATGVTKLNSGVVEIALEGIAHRSWHCVECDVTQKAAGDCPTCKQPLMAIEQTLLCHVAVDAESGLLYFDVLPEQSVRLSEIQAALTRFKVVLPPEQQVIPHSATLVVGGPASKEELAKLVTALSAGKLFEKVSGHLDEASGKAELEVRCVGSPPRPEVEKALVEACAGCSLADIVWTAQGGAGSRRG